MTNGISETIELRRAEFKEAPLQRAREFGTPIPVPGITPLVFALTVVQKSKEFDHEHIRSTRPRDRHGVMANSAPMMGPVISRPIEREATAYLGEKSATVIHGRVMFRVRVQCRSPVS